MKSSLRSGPGAWGRCRANLVPRPASLGPYLWLQVTIVGGGYNITVAFVRRVSFTDAGREYIIFSSRVWIRGSTGTHGGDPEFIVGGLDQLLDTFLNEYLRVNQA